jgi:outer membrane protein assembly factor BamD
MKKMVLIALSTVLLFGSCAKEFNRVYKSPDYRYKYEYAKECFANGKYNRAATLLQELIIQQKGTNEAQESLYMLAMAEFCDRNYETAAETFKQYVKSYPRGIYAEMASYYVGESLYMTTPEPRLDQSNTIQAIASYQEYLDLHPGAKLKDQAQQRLFDLQDKLVEKELYSAQLYYDLGSYFGNCASGGNNYEACIVTAQNALKDYPYSARRESFAVLIMKSKYELAKQSVDSKKLERYQDAEDECYGFINEYPDSKERKNAESYIEKCKKYTVNAVD